MGTYLPKLVYLNMGREGEGKGMGSFAPYPGKVPTLMEFPTLMGSDTLGGWVFVFSALMTTVVV